jgi:hypothetical protein
MRLFEIADGIEGFRKYRFAKQLRAAALSITNKIAEGSGSVSDAQFRNFLKILPPVGVRVRQHGLALLTQRAPRRK